MASNATTYPMTTATADRASAYVDLYGDAGESMIGANIRYVLAIARRNIWLILGIVAAALILAVIYNMMQTQQFTAATSVQINDQTEEVLGGDLETDFEGPSGWDIDRFLNTQLDILRSRSLAQRVAQSEKLYGNADFLARMGVAEPGSGMAERLKREQVIALLAANMDVDLPRSNRIARIRFTSQDPALASRLANAYAREFIQANLQRRFDQSSYARNFVAEELDEARQRLEQSELELNDYARSAGLLRTRDSMRERGMRDVGDLTSSSLLQLNEEANKAQAARVAAESRWQAERATPLFSSQTVLQNPTVQVLMARKTELEGQLQSARSRYLDDHPVVQQLSAELSTTESRLNSTAANVRDAVRAEAVAARDTEKQLASRVGQLRSQSLVEQDKAVRYNTLAREADTNRSIYDGLLQRYRALNASAGIASSNISVIDPADPPLSPSAPNLMRNIAIALFMGLGIAVVVVFLRDQFDDAVHGPDDVETKLGLRLLSVIPRSPDDTPMIDLDDPKSVVAEAYSSLRGSLIYSTAEGLPKIIMVSSAQEAEGKSTTSLAIADGLARLGRRTILIDADLRRPSLHHIAGLKNETGLSDLLVSKDEVSSYLGETDGRPYDVLTSGPLPPSPAELLASPRMAAILEEVSSEYDSVVIDSPPVLGIADAPTIASLADATVFVVEANRGHGGRLKTALRRLRGMDSNLIGAVLTKFDPNKAGNNYASYYGYDYYSYSENSRASG